MVLFDKNIIQKIRKVLLKYDLKYRIKKIHINKLFNELLKLGNNEVMEGLSSYKESSTNIFSSSTNINNDVSSMHSYSQDESNNTKENSIFTKNTKFTDEEIESLIEICNKFADKEYFIDIPRTLVLLENRLWISNRYKKYIEMLNMKYLLKGVMNYHFKSVRLDPIYEYKKIGHVLNKIIIKLKLLLGFIPKDCGTTIVNDFEAVNENYLDKKMYTYLKRINEQDNMSDYEDDDLEYLCKQKKIEKMTDLEPRNRKDINKITKILKQTSNRENR